MKLALSTALVALMCSSCATIMTGETDEVHLTSTPPGVDYRTNTGLRGRTPASIQVSDEIDLVIELAAEGYEYQTVQVPRRVSAWLLGNILFGGLIGLAIDVAGGGMYVHPGSMHVDMAPLPPRTSEPKATRAVVTSPGSRSFDEWLKERGSEPRP